VWLLVFRDTPEEHSWMTDEELVVIRGANIFSTGGGAPPPPRAFADTSPRIRSPRLGVAAGAASGKKVGERGDATPWRQLVNRMWLVTVVDFCYGWSLWVFLTWLPSYLSDARGFALNQMALMTTLPLLAGVVGDTLGGVISDVIYRRTGNLRLARRTLLVAGLGGAFAFIVPATVTGSAVGAVALLSAAFFFLELTNAVLWTLPLDIAGQYAGTAGGMMNTGFGVAGMISPVVFGVLIQRTGRYDLPLYISAGLLLAGALLSLRIDPTKQVGP
jgi:MFS family permease